MIHHLSPSGLATWRDCNLKWWFAYCSDIPKAPASVDMLVGSMTHRALEAMFGEEQETNHVLAARVGWAEYADQLPEGTDLADTKQRVWEALVLLHEWWSDADVYAAELEVEGTAPTPAGNEATFKGCVDLVERTALGSLRVRDAKTGAPPSPGRWFRERITDKLLQVQLYGIFVEMQEGLPVDSMHLDFTGTGRVETHSIRNKAGALEVWAEAWDDMTIASEDREYAAPNPGPLCGWCDFIAHCPEGQVAVRERDALNKNIGPAREVLGL